MKIYAVVKNTYNGAWTDSEFDLFFTTKDKAELRRQSLIKKNKHSDTAFFVREVEVGE